MTGVDRERREAFLRDIGVPSAFVDEIVSVQQQETRATPDEIRGFPPGALVAVQAVFGYFALFLAAFFYHRAVWDHAKALAEQYEATIFRVDAAVGIFIGLAAFTCYLFWSHALHARHYRVRGELVTVAKSLEPLFDPREVVIENCRKWRLRRNIASAVTRSKTSNGLLLALAERRILRRGVSTVVLATASITMLILETNRFWAAGPRGIVEHRLFPPFTKKTFSWTTAQEIETGCILRSEDETVRFIVRFPSGDAFDLGASRRQAGDYPTKLIDVNKRLPRKIQHVRLRTLVKAPLNWKCLGYWGKRFGPLTLGSLLRIRREELERRRWW